MKIKNIFIGNTNEDKKNRYVKPLAYGSLLAAGGVGGAVVGDEVGKRIGKKQYNEKGAKRLKDRMNNNLFEVDYDKNKLNPFQESLKRTKAKGNAKTEATLKKAVRRMSKKYIDKARKVGRLSGGLLGLGAITTAGGAMYGYNKLKQKKNDR